jgi:hypothetical protein
MFSFRSQPRRRTKSSVRIEVRLIRATAMAAILCSAGSPLTIAAAPSPPPSPAGVTQLSEPHRYQIEQIRAEAARSAAAAEQSRAHAQAIEAETDARRIDAADNAEIGTRTLRVIAQIVTIIATTAVAVTLLWLVPKIVTAGGVSAAGARAAKKLGSLDAIALQAYDPPLQPALQKSTDAATALSAAALAANRTPKQTMLAPLPNEAADRDAVGVFASRVVSRIFRSQLLLLQLATSANVPAATITLYHADSTARGNTQDFAEWKRFLTAYGLTQDLAKGELRATNLGIFVVAWIDVNDLVERVRNL